MSNVLISNLPTYSGNTDGVFVVMNDSTNTTTFKVTKETLVGASGTSGTSGSSGSSGSSGTTGASGSSGTSGSSGNSGSSGTSGSTGTSGSSGTSVAVSGTTNTLPKFTSSTTIGNSAITDDGTTVTLVSRALSGSTATFSSTVRPSTNFAADLGTSSIRWAEIFGYSINLTNNATISGTLGVTGTATFSGGTITLIGANTNYVYVNRAGTVSNEAATIYTTASDNKWTTGMRANGTNDYVIYSFSANSNVLRITEAAKVGIGTDSPSSKLQIGISNTSNVGLFSASGLAITTEGGSAGNIYQIAFGYGGGGATYASSSIYGLTESSTGFNTGALVFSTRSVTTDTAPTERMRITSNGAVLIGSTSNDYGKLDVTVSPSSYTAALGLGFTTNSGEGNSVGISFKTKVSISGAIWENARIAAITESITNSAYGTLAFYTMNATTLAERMRITSGGIVQVQSGGVETQNGGGYKFWNNEQSRWWLMYTYVAASNQLRFNYFGNDVASINPTSGAYTALSDINKKKDFEDSNIGLDEVIALKPTLYRMKNDESEGEKELGFIAQEVKEFIPQAYVEIGEDDKKFIGLNYNAIVAALVKSVQELKTEINQIKQLINN